MEINFFDINTVAIIWASEQWWKIWNDLLINLRNFKWEKFWVNPKWWNFEGIDFYNSISDLPIVVDIAVIVIPAKFVLQSLRECWEKWIKRVIIISAWFKETGNIEWENEIKEIANKYSMRVLWPNCLWYIDAKRDLNLSFWWKEISKWNIAMVSQSWAMAVALTDWANATHIWFSKLISMWNKSDINENDLLLNLENDPDTDVIAIYLESIEDWRSFYEITKRLSKKKPIVMIKAWVSKKWKEAASSHTWALSSENKVLEVAFQDSWIHTTSSLEDFFIWSELFSKTVNHNIPEELAIITNAWWPWVMATDHCETYNINLASFNKEEKDILAEYMPEASSMNNPIDIIWDATSVRYAQILNNITKLNRNIGILVLVTPQTVTDVDIIAEEIHKWEEKNPHYFILTSFMWWNTVKLARKYLRKNRIPSYDYPRKWLISYRELLKQKNWEQKKEIENANITKINDEIKKEISLDLKKENKLCSLATTIKLMDAFDISFLKDVLAKDIKKVENIWNNKKEDKLVAKISSKDIAHKTDCGWVILWISSLEEAKIAYEKIIKSVKEHHPEAEIQWVTFQEMLAESKKEVFIWMKRDLCFWELLIVWMWWIFVNIYEDVNMKLWPVNKDEIRDMFSKLTWYPILAGSRWDKSINFDSLVDIVFKIQSLFHIFQEIKEIDINPVFSNEKKSIIVDAKIYI